jgi:hypothetical protein
VVAEPRGWALLCLAVLLACGALPLLSLVGHPGAMLADPLSELPVKLWGFETFLHVGILGGRVPASAFPTGGPLNNADPVGTIVTAVLRPFFGRAGAYNLLVLLQIEATLLATYALLRTLVADRFAAVLGAVAFGLTPLVLVYGVAGAITDLLNLWPYPLAMRALLRLPRGRGWRDGAEAGLWLGVGFVTCPYDFLVLSAMAVPAVFWLPLGWRGGFATDPPPAGTRSRPRAMLRKLFALAVVGGLIAGPSAWSVRAITNADDSQMPKEVIELTRHVPPYLFLQPGHVDRYTAYLADYVAVGKAALISRDAGSRYYRAFSPGLSLLALGLVGLVLQRRRVATTLWATVAVFCAVASTGPFLPVTGRLHLDAIANPAWLFMHDVMPGGTLLLEPFRYGLGAALALAVVAAMGVDALARRVGRWVGAVALWVWLLELVAISPVPVPLPVATMTVPAVYATLDARLPPGAILELPCFDAATDRLLRVHFLDQLVHHRPIPEQVVGFPARYLTTNQFTASLLAAEKSRGRLHVQVTNPARIEADRQQFIADGFAAIVVTPKAFVTKGIRDAVLALLTSFGTPERADDRLVFQVAPAAAEVPDAAVPAPEAPP